MLRESNNCSYVPSLLDSYSSLYPKLYHVLYWMECLVHFDMFSQVFSKASILFILEALFAVSIFGFIFGMDIVKPNHIRYVSVVSNEK